MTDFRKYPRAFSIEFIDLYKSLPSTWKITSREYSNRDKKSQDYELLVEKLKEVEPNANRELVIKRINNLRSVYRRELKKVKKAKSGMGTEEVATPSLWYFEYLHFLDDQELPRQSTSTIEINENIENNWSNDSTLIDTSTSDSTPSLMPPPSPAPSSVLQVESPAVSPSLPSTSSSSPLNNASPAVPPALPSTSSSLPSSSNATEKSAVRRGAKRVLSKNEAVLSKIVKELEKSPQMDRFDHLALSWTGILKNIPKEQAIFAEKIINDVLFEAQLNNLSRNSCFQVNNTMNQPSIQHLYPPIQHQQQSQYPTQYHAYSTIQYPSQQLQQQPYSQMFNVQSHQQQPQYQQHQIQPQQHEQPIYNQYQLQAEYQEQQQAQQSSITAVNDNREENTHQTQETIVDLINNFNC